MDKVNIIGYEGEQVKLTESRKRISSAENIFRSKRLSGCDITLKMTSKKDVKQAIQALKVLYPCFD